MKRSSTNVVGRASKGGLAVVVLAAGLALVGGECLRAQVAGVADVVSVEIPTRVIGRDGQPVRGLLAADFEVLEGKLKREVVHLEVFDLGDPGATDGPQWSSPVHPAARRRFMFLFDLAFSSSGSVEKAREGVLEMLDRGLHPSDLVGVARYTASRGVEVVLGMTSDRHQARRAVESLGAIDPAHAANDPLKLMLVRFDNREFQQLGEAGAGVGGAGLAQMKQERYAEMLDHFEDLTDEKGKSDRSDKENSVLALSSALAGFAEHLKSISGYKQVVFLSEGFDSSFVSGTTSQARTEDLARAAAEGDVSKIDSEEIFGGSRVRDVILEMTETFRRADCTIHSLDIGGLRVAADVRLSSHGEGGGFGATRSEDGLFLISDQTGGRFVRNHADLGEAMQELLEVTAVTYVLVVEPQDLSFDGSFHPIEVRLKKGKRTHLGTSLRGARTLHRPGYYAPVPFGSQAGEIKRLTAADLLATGGDGGKVATGVLASAFPGDGSRAEVVTWVEMYGYGLLDQSPGGRLPVEVYVYAFDEDGAVADFAAHAVMIDLDRHRQQIEAQGFKHVMRLSVEPGRYHLRTLVRNTFTGATGLTTQILEVPDFSARAAHISAPLFLEPEGIWLVDWSDELEEAGADYPLQQGTRRLLPSTEPVVLRGREIPMLLLGVGLSGAPERLEAELVPSTGDEPSPIRIALDDFQVRTEGSRIWTRLTAPPEVRPGRYDLLVRAVDSSLGRLADASIPVLVR